MSCTIRDILKTSTMADIGMTHLKTFEYAKVTRAAVDIAKMLGFERIIMWKKSEGLMDMNDNNKVLGTLKNLSENKKMFERKTIIIFQDVHRIYDDPKLLLPLQKILEFASRGELPVNTVGMSPSGIIPEEIERYTQIEIIELPSKESILEQIEVHFEDYGVFVGRSMLNKIAEMLTGLIEDEVSLLLNRILVTCFNDGILIDEKILHIAQKQKKQQIEKSGILKFITPDVGIDDVGGLPNLKTWLRERKGVFDDPDKALKFGVKPPKGILLFGMPGSGKSLTAKVSANYFNLPLLRVDMGLVYGQKSPEEAIGRMIALADAISPCVLWIDELEKALAGSENGGTNDVAIKILGILLTWMQERTKPVFIVATANDISMIRPETYRDGRLDEKFMLGFLNDDVEQIGQIIEIHLRSRLKDEYGHSVRSLNYMAITRKMVQMVKQTGDEKSAGYTGANLEALVEKVLHERFTRKKIHVETKDFVRALNNVFPQRGIIIKQMLKRASEIEAIEA